MKRQSWLMMSLLILVLMLSACVVPAASAPAASAPAVAESDDPRAGWPTTFRVGLFGGDDAEAVLESNEPFRAYMEEQLGIPVELFTGTSYSAVIEAMRANRVDAMQVGPFSYVLAVQEAGAEALAVGISTRADPAVYDPSLPAHYYSVIFTKKGSGIDSLDDLAGKDFAFVDPASTSGHLAPKTALIKLGIDPDTQMNTVFAGSHPSAVIAVWNDKVPAGATHEGNLYRMRDQGQIEFCGFEDNQTAKPRTQEEVDALYASCPEGHIAIIAYSDPIPNTPFAVRANLPESFKAAVRDVLLSVKDNEELIAEWKRWFVDPTAEMGFERLDHYYNSLRDIARLLDLDLTAMD